MNTTWAQSRTTCRGKDTAEEGKFSLRFIGMITNKLAMPLSFGGAKMIGRIFCKDIGMSPRNAGGT